MVGKARFSEDMSFNLVWRLHNNLFHIIMYEATKLKFNYRLMLQDFFVETQIHTL